MEIAKLLIGSHSTGLAHADSDRDYLQIVMPKSVDIWLNQLPGSNVKSTDDEDTTIMHLPQFVSLVLEGSMNILDALYLPDENIIECHPIWKEHIVPALKEMAPVMPEKVREDIRSLIKLHGEQVMDDLPIWEETLAIFEGLDLGDTRIMEAWDIIEPAIGDKGTKMDSPTSGVWFMVLNGTMRIDCRSRKFGIIKDLNNKIAGIHKRAKKDPNKNPKWKSFARVIRHARQVTEHAANGYYSPICSGDMRDGLLDIIQGNVSIEEILDGLRLTNDMLAATPDIVNATKGDAVDAMRHWYKLTHM